MIRADRAVTRCGELCGHLGTTGGFLRVPGGPSPTLSYPGVILWTAQEQQFPPPPAAMGCCPQSTGLLLLPKIEIRETWKRRRGRASEVPLRA